MQLTDFLRAILPAKGTYYTASINAQKKIKQTKHDTIDDAQHSLEAMTGLNAYIATGSYKKQRTQKECRAKRCWYIDIDCKPGKEYDSKLLGREALQEALKLGLPRPSIIVDTGNGFHVYWVINTDVNEPAWIDVAQQVEAACAHTNLRIDPTSTKDAARILRAPETVNWKDPKHPLPCKIMYDKGPIYTHKELQEAFAPYHAPAQKPRASNVVNLVIPAGMPDDLWAGLPERNTMPTKAQDMIDQCPLYGEAVATGGSSHAEPLWRGLIQTLAYCDDGKDFIHAISNQHPHYNEYAVTTKYNQALRKKADAGPYKCDTFAKNSSVCQTCPYYGTITTPLALAYGIKSLLPYPWRDGTYGVERFDEEDQIWVKTINYKVNSVEAACDFGVQTAVKFDMGGKQINTDLTAFADTRTLHGVLAKYNRVLIMPQAQELIRLMTAWMQQLTESKQVSTLIKGLGWTKDGFHYGGQIYKKDGSVAPAFITDPVFHKTYSPSGDFDPWQKCANHILSQPRHAVWCIMAAAFGAPLMTFTGATGSILSVVSRASGTGKSTAMKVAQATWAEPTKGMFMLDDKPLAVAHKLGDLNNLPGYWDEVREKHEVQDFIKTIFRIGQGRERQRLNSNITARDSGSWSTMLIVATNEALKDHINQTIGTSDAGEARVFEIYASDIHDPSMNDAQARHFYQQVNSNYGHAGAKFAGWLAQNRKVAEATVNRIEQAISVKFDAKSDERFWVATMSCLLAGAQLATNQGLCTFDMKEFKDYLVKSFLAMRKAKKNTWESTQVQSIKMMSQFVHQHKDHTVKSTTLPHKGKYSGKILVPALRNPVKIRLATDQKVMRVLLDDFQKWSYDAVGAGYSNIVSELVDMGARKGRGSIDGGTLLSISTRQNYLDFPLSIPEFNNEFGGFID